MSFSRVSVYHLASVSSHKLASEYSGDATQSLRREILVRNLLLNLYQQDRFEELLRDNPENFFEYFLEDEFEEDEPEDFENPAKRIKHTHTKCDIAPKRRDGFFIHHEIAPPSAKFTFFLDSQESPSSTQRILLQNSHTSKGSAACSNEPFGLKNAIHLMLSLSLD